MNPSRRAALREGAPGAPLSALLPAQRVTTVRASVPTRIEGGAR
jgi:hypothetical protein